jgi:O-antigen/teichoic acid export membrane protein
MASSGEPMKAPDQLNTAVLPQPSIPELKNKLKLGLLWNTGINLFRDVLQFGVMLVMVRLLDPKAYGQFGLVNSFLAVFTILSFRPFVEHSLQPRSNQQVDYQIYFTAGAFLQPLIFVAVNVLAVFLRRTHDYAGIAPLLHVMSILFLLDGMSEFRTKMLERALDWQRLRLLQGAGIIMSAIIGLCLALSGFGVYALLVPSLTATLPFIYDLLYVKRWRPDWTWNTQSFRPARQYGLSRMASGILTNGRGLLEGSVLVHAVGFASFGIYGRATGLAAITCLRLPFLLTQTIYPVLTKLERRTDAYRKANSLILRAITWTVVPLAAMLSLLGGPMVKTLYGNKWLAAIPLLPWAMAAGTATAVMQTVESLLLANCQQSLCIVSEIALCLGTVIALGWFLPHGTATYLIGITLAQSACLLLSLFWLRRGKAITVSAVSQAFVPTLLASAIALGACSLLQQWLPGVRDLFFAQIGFGLIFIVVCAIVFRTLFVKPLKELTDTMPFGPFMRRLLFLP